MIVIHSYSENAQNRSVSRVSNLNYRRFLKKIREEQPLLYKILFCVKNKHFTGSYNFSDAYKSIIPFNSILQDQNNGQGKLRKPLYLS